MNVYKVANYLAHTLAFAAAGVTCWGWEVNWACVGVFFLAFFAGGFSAFSSLSEEKGD